MEKLKYFVLILIFALETFGIVGFIYNILWITNLFTFYIWFSFIMILILFFSGYKVNDPINPFVVCFDIIMIIALVILGKFLLGSIFTTSLLLALSMKS